MNEFFFSANHSAVLSTSFFIVYCILWLYPLDIVDDDSVNVDGGDGGINSRHYSASQIICSMCVCQFYSCFFSLLQIYFVLLLQFLGGLCRNRRRRRKRGTRNETRFFLLTSFFSPFLDIKLFFRFPFTFCRFCPSFRHSTLL